MKLWSILFAFFLTQNALAYETLTCSNSAGTAAWEISDHNNEIHLKYFNFVEGTLTLSVDQVNIQMNREIPITDKKFIRCGHSERIKVYAGAVRITAARKNPNILKSYFPENKVETEVICTHTIYSQTECFDENNQAR